MWIVWLINCFSKRRELFSIRNKKNMFHGVNVCFKKFYLEQCILKINIKIDSFNYFSQFNKDWIHTFALYSFYFTIYMGYWPSVFGQDGWILASFFFCVFMDRDEVSWNWWVTVLKILETTHCIGNSDPCNKVQLFFIPLENKYLKMYLFRQCNVRCASMVLLWVI